MTEHHATPTEPVPFEITLHCGCVIDGKSDGNAGWTFCPLHKAAPDLLAALDKCQKALESLGQATAPFISGAISSRNSVVCAALAASSHALTEARAAIAKAHGQ